MAMAMAFGERLAVAVRAVGAPVGVGLDPHLDRLPRDLQAQFQGRPAGAARREAAAAAVVAFSQAVIAGARGRAAAIKPQFAFYEQLGAPGWAALEETCRMARAAGLLIIGDAKRGDISSTAEAYAHAILDPEGPLGCDAVTLSPWMGADVLDPFLVRCDREGRGIFVLVRTTNPGSALLQRHAGAAEHLAEMLGALGAARVDGEGFSPVGAVVGAQVAAEAQALRAQLPHAWFLVPGVGAQGGAAQEGLAGARPDGLGALVVSSRGVLFPETGALDRVTQVEALVATRLEALQVELRAVKDDHPTI